MSTSSNNPQYQILGASAPPTIYEGEPPEANSIPNTTYNTYQNQIYNIPSEQSQNHNPVVNPSYYQPNVIIQPNMQNQPISQSQPFTQNIQSPPYTSSALCSFYSSGHRLIVMNKYSCLTCSYETGNVCCEVCAKICHRGHQLRFLGMGPAYCDCGSDLQCECMHRPLQPNHQLGTPVMASVKFLKQQSQNFNPAYPGMVYGQPPMMYRRDMEDDCCTIGIGALLCCCLFGSMTN